MPTKEQVLELMRAGRSYEDVGAHFAIPAGQAYMIATGLPADGSDAIGPEFMRAREGLLPGSSQHLANPPTEVPQRDPEVDEWLKRRAGADQQMQAAAASRTAEPPAVAGEDETDDIVSAIGWDHNQVKYLLEQLQAVPGVRKGGRPEQQHQRASIVDMVRVRLSQHEVAEEEHFWPMVRGSVPGGGALADHGIEQEQEGKELLRSMSKMSGTEEDFDEHVEKLVLALRKHVAFEDLVLLKVSESVPEEERREAGRRYQSAKRHAGPRPERGKREQQVDETENEAG